MDDPVRTEVDKLISLLDQYLFLQGETLTSYKNDFVSVRKSMASQGAQEDVPASLKYFPVRT